MLDPGFGFGKLGAENLALLKDLQRLQRLRLPVLIGLSRKGFLAKAVEAARPGIAGIGRVAPTVAANAAAILSGAHLLRVHDVRPAVEAAAIVDGLLAELPA